MMNKLKDFFLKQIWLVPIAKEPRLRAAWLLICRVLSVTYRFFIRNRCVLHASALTYFTVLSLVPIAALIFGIAKGYGFDEILKTKLHESLPGQEQITERIISFSENALSNASGGVMAGAGILILLWTALKLLTNIENAFNEIWGVRTSRTLMRKLSDYLTLLLLFPCLLIALATSSAIAFSFLQKLTLIFPFISPDNQIAAIGSKILPFLLAWISFSFLYLFIPNTKVKLKAALISGAFTGILYICVQFGYIYLQKILTGYNAIYGSFAALPFFLIWLQISWSLILLGGQISFAVQNVNSYELVPDEDLPFSLEARILFTVRIMGVLACRFEEQKGPVSVQELSDRLEIPIRLVRSIMFDLCECGAAARLVKKSLSDELYQTAVPVAHLTVTDLLQRMFRYGTPVFNTETICREKEILESLWKTARESKDNRLLLEIQTPGEK